MVCGTMIDIWLYLRHGVLCVGVCSGNFEWFWQYKEQFDWVFLSLTIIIFDNALWIIYLF